jgi:osmotically-inducible protein OsmY
MKKLLLIVAMACSLQGCFFVAGAAAGAAAITVVYDHRKIEKIAQDKTIAKRASDQIQADPELADNTHIIVTCFNQTLLLTGQATTPELRQRAEELVSDTPKIKRIYNQITIQGPTSALTRTSDSWITTKITTRMLATEGLKSSTIKVITENGTVYLMGIVTHQQANIAVDIAREISGVQKVMKIFQYSDR